MDEIDLFAYLEILWHHRWPLLGLILAAMAVAAILSWWVIPPAYEANSVVMVTQVNQPDQSELTLGSPETYRNLFLSGPTLRRAASNSAIAEDIFERAVKVQIVPNTNLLKLTVQAPSKEQAEALGEAWQKSYRITVEETWNKSISSSLGAERARLEGMHGYLRELTILASSPQGLKAGTGLLVDSEALAAAGEVKRLERLQQTVARGELSDLLLVTPFRASKDPVAPHKALNVAIAGFLAAMVGMMGVIGLEGWRGHQAAIGRNAVSTPPV